MTEARKRSIGVSILAVLFIVGGVWLGIQSISFLWLAPKMLAVHDRLYESMLENMREQGREEQYERLRAQFDVIKRKSSEMMNARSTRLFFLLSAGLGLLALVVGIGLWKLKLRAPRFALIQTGSYLVLNLVWLFMAQRQSPGLIREMSLTLEPQQQEMMAQVTNVMMPVQFAVTFVLYLGWFLFLLWFFRRESVRAQFAG